jgi:dolichyl-phosphate beta-glucosyltransferase
VLAQQNDVPVHAYLCFACAPGKGTMEATDEQHVHLSVVVPAYNEEGRLSKSLPAIMDYLSRQSYAWEVLIIDDGSSDRTGEIAARIGENKPVRVLQNNPNRGKGYSIRYGMLEARGKYRLFSDADLSTPIEELDHFWKPVAEGYDVVIGSRAVSGSRLEVRQARYREWMGRAFNLLVRMMLVPGIHDTQCGFKLFSEKAATEIFPRQTLQGFAFDVELLILARKHGYKVKEFPVRWINSPATTVSAWRDSSRMFVDLVRLKFRH